MRILRFIAFLKEYSDGILALGVLGSVILYMGSVSSKATEAMNRVDRQRDHIIRTDEDFQVYVKETHAMLIQISNSAARIEQWQQGFDKRHPTF